MDKHPLSGITYTKNYWQEIKRYALLLLIPLVFCIVLHLSVQSVLNRQIKENAANTASQIYIRTSAMMHEVEMVNDAIFMDIAALNNAPEGQTLPYQLNDPASICRQLEIRKSNSMYIKHIYLVSEKWPHIFSDIGYYNYNSLESLLARVGTDQASFESIDEPTWNMQTTSHLTDPFCVIPYRDSDNNVVGHVLITLDLTIFMETLSEVNARFVCLYNQDSFITSQLLSENVSSVDWNNERAVSDTLGTPVKCFYIHLDDYTYLAAIDRAEYYYPLRAIAVCFIIYAFLVSLLGFLYLSKVSKERYQQLSALITALPQSSDDTPITYKELLPKVQETLLTLRDKENASRPTASERILHGVLYADKGADLSKNLLEKIGITSSETLCYVAIFYIRSFDTVALISNHTDDAREMSWVIFQSSLTQFTAQDMKQISCMDPGSFAAVFFEPKCDDFGDHVTQVCENVCQFMAESYGIRTQVAVSSAVAPHELCQAFRQAQSLEKFAVAIDSSSYIISQDSLHEGDVSLLIDGNFIRQEQLLLNTLLMEKYNLIPSMVDAILREHVRPLASDYALATSRLRAVSNILSETLLSTNPTGVDVAAAIAKLEAANSISALNDAAKKVYTPLAQSMTTGVRSYKEVGLAQQYIRDNLSDQNLNVSMICEAVGIISQRLTPMFQEQLSMGIAEYVNYCRIEQAKELLTTTKLTVKKVGERVGYSTNDTFTRNFRKLENLTPTEYRRIVS